MANDYYLAHCISADFALGAGIAKQFVEKLDIKNKLISLYSEKRFKKDIIGKCLLTGNVFNLVTKEKYYYKPTYNSLECCLTNMKVYCLENNIKKIAMPKIGCGLDRLEWNKVKQIILDTFEDTDIEIVICIKE